MQLSQKCPCCGEKFSFWSYFNQDNFKDREEDDEHIKCNKCDNVILLSHRKRTISNIGVLVIFVVSMYLFVEGELNILWAIGLLFFILLTSYLSYIQEELACFRDNDSIDNVKEDNMSGIIFAIILLSSSAIMFWLIFSFAIDMKEENKQKIHNEQEVIKIQGEF